MSLVIARYANRIGMPKTAERIAKRLGVTMEELEASYKEVKRGFSFLIKKI